MNFVALKMVIGERANAALQVRGLSDFLKALDGGWDAFAPLERVSDRGRTGHDY
jgi:hypothetical protein